MTSHHTHFLSWTLWIDFSLTIPSVWRSALRLSAEMAFFTARFGNMPFLLHGKRLVITAGPFLFFFFFTFNTLFFIIAAGYILVTSYHVPLGGVVE